MSHFVAAGLIAIALAHLLIKSFGTRPSLSKIRGPKSPSFLLGNLLELSRRPAGEIDFEWQKLYGDVVRFKSVLGGSQLLIADPKALQRIFESYDYMKQPHLRVITRMLVGKGIVWADGEDHRRQRKILVPGFGAPESTAFKDCAESMCEKWMEVIENNEDKKVVLDIPAWLSRGTLDAIGQAVFDVQLGTIQNEDNPLAKKYHNMRSEIFGCPSPQQIFIQAASKYLPTWTLEWMTDYGSSIRLQRARNMKRMGTEVAKELVREKAEMLFAGQRNRDIFSLLVKANIDTEAKNKLTEEELLAQMRTILLAGHETTSNTLNWMLFEFARNPKVQSRLRAEIREMEARIRARGDTQFTATDFDGMPYLTAVIKEGLRYHPVVPHVYRIAGKDDILSLARPVTTESGRVISEVVVPKGTPIVVSICGYNRNKELWGEDAHEFNPDRWLGSGMTTENQFVSIGIYSNLMTFIGGTRACLGWRFAIIEIQTFLVEIIGRFELTMTERSKRVRRGPPVLMLPLIEGELERGAQLPLAVSVAVREDDA